MVVVLRWLRTPLSLLLLALLALALAAPAAGAPGQDRVVVLIKAAPDALAALKAQYGVGFDYGADGFATEISAAALAGLQRRPDVFVEVQPLREVLGRFEGLSGRKTAGSGRPAVPTDQVPWGIEVTYNDTTTSSTSGGNGLLVAVLDTGVASHVDLPRPVVCVDASNGSTARFGSCKDGHGHGTHVTGTILANAGADHLGIYGVAPGARYSAYKVCSNGGTCNAAAIAWSIRHAADNGANIISMSLGGSAMSTAEKDAIDYAVGKGVLVIAAAGNSGPNLGTISYPGAYAKVVAVAALQTVDGSEAGDRSRNVSVANLKVTDFSSRGINDGDFVIEEREVEVAAPGYQVESTFKDGTYAIWSGTSMATPHVSGLAAKMWQGSAAATRTWLQNNARGYDVTQGQYATTGDDPASGFGNPRVN